MGNGDFYREAVTELLNIFPVKLVLRSAKETSFCLSISIRV